MNKNTVDKIARGFLSRVKRYLGDAKFNAATRANNSEDDAHICHYQDYCDANVFLARSFRSVTGKEPRMNSQRDVDLFNAAYNRAKEMMRPPMPEPLVKVLSHAEALALTGMEAGDFWLVTLCVWPDRSGWYDRQEDGKFACTVFNESEIFEDEAAARRFLYNRVEITKPQGERA